MSYEPKIDILSRQPRSPVPADLSFKAILERFPSLASADAVGLTGSVAAGWGNPYSDIDIYAFSDAELDLPVDETAELWPGSDKNGLDWMEWIGRYGDIRVDLSVWPTNAVSRALRSVRAPEDAEFYSGGSSLEDFLYRVSIATPLAGADLFARLREEIADSGYRQAVARHSKVVAENALTDALGQIEAGDTKTALVSALRAAACVTDLCLLLAGELCRGEKWILRRLEKAPQCGISLAEYRSIAFESPRPDESDGEAALRIARWAQAQIVRTEDELLRSGGPPTPTAGLEVNGVNT
jgi:hypothetical protein